MVIKSQQDIKNETKAKSEKVPKSMEGKSRNTPQSQDPEESQPIIPLIERVTTIEAYLARVDQAFEKIVTEIDNLRALIKITQNMDVEISKLTGDVIRLTQLEENRYIELATAINSTNEKLKTLDEFIPIFIDNRLDEYFSEITSEKTESVDDQETK
jgi:hypothetical protein